MPTPLTEANTGVVKPNDRDCIPAPPEAPICATVKCKRPLTYLGPPQNCWRCLVCNPIVEAKKTEPRQRRDIDVQLSEERVLEMIKDVKGSALDEEQIREIIQDELQNWMIQKPPITAKEIDEAVGGVDDEPIDLEKIPETWFQKAKRLGVDTHKKPAGTGMRKKAEVLAEIATKENREVPVEGGY